MQFHPAESICRDFIESKSNPTAKNLSAPAAGFWMPEAYGPLVTPLVTRSCQNGNLFAFFLGLEATPKMVDKAAPVW
jgi:hypothetical protein